MAVKNVQVLLSLDFDSHPDESALIQNLIDNNNLSVFLYTICNDMIEGRYSLEAGNTKILLDNIIETLQDVFKVVGAMDTNIGEVANTLNTHSDILSQLKNLKVVETIPVQEAEAKKELEEAMKEVAVSKDKELIATVEAVELDFDLGGGDEIEISDDHLDMFDDL